MARDTAPLSLSGWPYSPLAPGLRAGMSRKDGGGKVMGKRGVYWTRDDKADRQNYGERMQAPRNKRERRGENAS